jgi:uroporphyrinogen decarboxylase
MNGRERVLAVLRHELPDRVPTFEWEVHLVEEMTGDGTYSDFIRQYGHDAVVAKPDYILTPDSEGTALDEWGVSRTQNYLALDKYAPLKTREDVEQFVPPDPWAPNRFATLKSLVQEFKGEKAIIVNLRDVWSNPRDLLGYENLLVNCALDPELVKYLVEKCVEHSQALIQHAAEIGAEVVMSNDDIADNRRTFISLQMWDELFMPSFVKFVNTSHEAGLFVWKHTDGNILSIMDRLTAAGIAGIDPVDLIAGMKLEEFKERWGDQVAIKGNVDQAYLLVNGTKWEVVEAVKACIRAAGKGGGFVCSSSNVIHSGVNPELYKVMLNAIRDFGKYPLDLGNFSPAEE